ncbi:MAG: ABC transporter permease [Bryobacteraceae bacterium]
MGSLLREARLAVRSLARESGYTATVLLTLALCVAANTAVFAIVNSVLLRPLPVPNADRIVLTSNRYPNAGVMVQNESATGDYFERLKGVPALEHQALLRQTFRPVEVGDRPDRMAAMEVTPSIFQVIGVNPALGRPFTPEEGEPGNDRKAILSDSLWRQAFGGDPQVIGKNLRVDGQQRQVVGVMPRGFTFIDPDVRFWIPLALGPEDRERFHSNNTINIGTLRPGAAIGQAQAQVNAVNHAVLDRTPELREALVNAGFHSKVEPLAKMLVRDVEGSLYLLWYGAVAVLLIGALNIANLTLARWGNRSKEVAARLALGATRGQLARQFLVETGLLSAAGGIAGVGLGVAVLKALELFGLDRFPRASEVRVDVTVIAVTLALTTGVSVLLGLLPIAESLKVSLSSVLYSQGRGATVSAGARRVRQALVAGQIGLAFALLAGAGLLLESFRNLLHVDPGFSPNGVVTVSASPAGASYPDQAALRAWMRKSLAAASSVRGVAAAGATSNIPFGGQTNDSVILAEHYVMRPGESVVAPTQVIVTPGYFEAMKIGLVRGRYFTERDDETMPGAVIVDEKVAAKFWPNADPVGKRMYRPSSPKDMTPGPDTQWLNVVGVVRAVRIRNLEDVGMGAYYFPYAQQPRQAVTFAVRGANNGGSIGAGVRSALLGVDRALPLFDMQTMSRRGELSLASRRTALLVAMGFGLLALFLAGIGVYGVLAYLVAGRRREIGIRMALGSTAGGVAAMVLREGLILVAAGLAIGLTGAVLLRKAVESEIYGVRLFDPLVMLSAMLLLAAIAVAACIAPARRAAMVDPARVLGDS